MRNDSTAGVTSTTNTESPCAACTTAVAGTAVDGTTHLVRLLPLLPGHTAAPTELERVSAYTQPSVVYIDITWTGYVYDTFNKLYLNNEKPFQLTYVHEGQQLRVGAAALLAGVGRQLHADDLV